MLAKIALVVQAVSFIVPLVERLIGRGKGAEKHAAARELVVRLLEKFGVAATPAVIELVDETIDLIVAIINETGGFDPPKKGVK